MKVRHHLLFNKIRPAFLRKDDSGVTTLEIHIFGAKTFFYIPKML